MSLSRRARRLAPVLALSLVPAYGFVSVDVVNDPEMSASDNVGHVAQLRYAGYDLDGDGEAGGSEDAAPNRGTDLEFATLTLDADVLSREGINPAQGDADGDRSNGFQRTYSFAGSYQNGLQIVDVTDPGEAAIVAVYDCGVQQGDVQVFERDGRTYVAYTHDSGYTARRDTDCYEDAEELGLFTDGDARSTYGTFIADVSDPYNPETVSFVQIDKGSHNQTVHPSGEYLYNSNSDLITSVPTNGIEVYDIRDFRAPRYVTTMPLDIYPGLGSESHDLTFNEDGTRAYSAALSHTAIIDTTNPEEPFVITSIVDPAINVEHQANPITIDDPVLGEREFLIVEDEFAGAAGAEQTCPSGGVHVYDISNEEVPVKVGYWNADDITSTKAAGLGRCTAHVFELHPDEALMTISFYALGVSVVDLSGLVGVALGGDGVGMKEVAYAEHPDSQSWAVKAPYVSRTDAFHIYSNDQNRGMDIYRVDLELAPLGDAASVTAGTGRGTWLSPVQADQLLANRKPVKGYTPFCLLGEDGTDRGAGRGRA